MTLSILSAMREAGRHKITVKGGKYMEILSKADTVIFDKTGTLTNACPTVRKVVPFHGLEESEMLRVAACLEEHFPHSVADAVVRAARERGLDHQEMHSEVEYVVAHGIATRIGEERVIIGSRHFVFEDEGVQILPEDQAAFDALGPDCSWLYLAIGGVLAVAIGSGASIAREVADVTIAADDLRELVLLRELSQRLMGRIHRNYRFVMGFNSALIALGAVGVLPPATSALLHNSSTLFLSMECMTPLLQESSI